MTIEQRLVQEIEECLRALNGPNDDIIYRRDESMKIELINWVLEKMKDPNIQICAVIESKINEIINEIKTKNTIIEKDPLDSELRTLDWIFFQVCSNEIKNCNRVID